MQDAAHPSLSLHFSHLSASAPSLFRHCHWSWDAYRTFSETISHRQFLSHVRTLFTGYVTPIFTTFSLAVLAGLVMNCSTLFWVFIFTLWIC